MATGYYRVKKDEYDELMLRLMELKGLAEGLKTERDNLRTQVAFLQEQNLKLIESLTKPPTAPIILEPNPGYVPPTVKPNDPGFTYTC